MNTKPLSSRHPLLRGMIPLARGLAEALGEDYEIILHDLSDPEHSILAAHNSFTRRSPGGPITDLGLIMLQSEEYRDLDYLPNYLAYTKEGREIRANCLFIRDDNRHLLGFLCINYDMTNARVLEKIASALTKTVRQSPAEGGLERFPANLEQLLAQYMEDARKEAGRPLNLMGKPEKIALVKELETKGFFRMKGSIEALARALGNTKYTVYAYLREARKKT